MAELAPADIESRQLPNLAYRRVKHPAAQIDPTAQLAGRHPELLSKLVERPAPYRLSPTMKEGAEFIEGDCIPGFEGKHRLAVKFGVVVAALNHPPHWLGETPPDHGACIIVGLLD